MVNSGSLSTFARDEQHHSGGRQEHRRTGSSKSSATEVHSSPRAQDFESSPRGPIIVSPAASDSSESQDQDRGMRSSSSIPPTLSDADAYDLSHFFVVDSFNIHRLVIAGVTCASKFFSDVFYTNSRYAKVWFHNSKRYDAKPHAGWRTTPQRIESLRITISSTERFSIICAHRRARRIRDNAC